MKKRRKIFQRAAALLCCILLLPSLAAVPVSADTVSNNFMDLTEYLDLSVITLTPSNPNIILNLPTYSVVYYVDMLFSLNGSISSITVIKGSQSRNLTILSLGSGIYRAYGQVSGNGSSSLTLNCGVSATAWMEILSFDCALFQSDSFAETAGLWVSDSPTSSGIITMPNSSTPVTAAMKYQKKLSTSQYSYNSVIYLSNWRKYDYMDVYFTLTDADISSLVVKLDSQYIPFECSFIGDPDITDFYCYEVNGEKYYFPAGISSYMHVMVRLDLSQLDRTDSGTVQIFCSGQYGVDDILLECNASMKLTSVTGFISSETSELSLFWFKLRNFLANLFSGDNDFEASVDHAVSNADSGIGEIDDSINELPTPSPEDMQLDFLIGGSGADVSTVRDFFNAIFNIPIIYWIMFLSFMFMFASFILYGSK